MSSTKARQDVRITGSSGVTIGPIEQRVGGSADSASGELARSILFVAADTLEASQLRLDREAKAIEEALHSAGVGERVRLHHRWAAGVADLVEGLLSVKPDVVHLAGHGLDGGRLVFAGPRATRHVGTQVAPRGESEPEPAEALAELLASAAPGLRCAVLATCHSEVVAESVAGRIGCAVGMAGEIEDSAAIAFAATFYAGLARGESVAAAYGIGVARVAVECPAWCAVPRLVVRGVDASSLVPLPASAK